MKIALDSWVLGQRFRNQGIYVYAQQLFREFQRLAAREQVAFTLFTGAEGRDDATALGAGANFELKRALLLDYSRLWRAAGASIAAMQERADLLFAPTTSVFPWGVPPVVCTIHDVTPVVMPSHAAGVTAMQRVFLQAAARLSRAVITDSECSRKDLVNIYGIPETKVSVVYLGYNKAVFNDEPPDAGAQRALRRRFGLERPYIVHHGVLQPRKNLKRLVEAYRLLLSRNRSLDLDLVLAGRLGWQYQEIVESATAPGPGRVVLTGVLPEEELGLLVKSASLAVIPSLYEGFCLPMVECMASGTPTLAARASCLPEVSGGVLGYFDPLSVEEMTERMREAIEDSQWRDELARKGKQQAAKFGWERCATETLAILKSQAGRSL